MSLQIEHLSSVYFTSKATIGSLFLFNEFINESNIRENEFYTECKAYMKKLFPDLHESNAGMHIGIIGLMALKEAPFYHSKKGGSKGGVGFLIAHTGQFLLLLYFLVLMWSAYKNLETQLLSNNLEIINISPSGNETYKKVTVVDLMKDPEGIAAAIGGNLEIAAQEKIFEFTEKATKQASNIAEKRIESIRTEFKKRLPTPKEDNNFLTTIGQLAGFIQNAQNGLLVENAIDIVSTETEFAIDELQRTLFYELNKEIAQFKYDVKNTHNKVKYDINTYIGLFQSNAKKVIFLFLTMSGTAGVQQITFRNSAKAITNHGGGKQIKKTRKKRKRRIQKRKTRIRY